RGSLSGRYRQGGPPASGLPPCRCGMSVSLAEMAYELGLHVDLQALTAAFVAEAGILDAAKRRLGKRDTEVIDGHHAAFERVGNLGCDLGIFGEGVAGEAER